MARIRTIKPDFFRHEGLQDLEIANPGKYPMMVFEALWGHCDSKGRFEWRPRQLKLDILPFLPFEMSDTLNILADADMVRRYVADGKEYGEIATFKKHQRLSGKELTEGEKYPEPQEYSVKQQGSVREILESQEGKGREEERKGIKPSPDKPARFDPLAVSLPQCVANRDWEDWISYRRKRKLSNIEETILGQLRNLEVWHTSGHSPHEIIQASITSGWQGLFEPKKGNGNGTGYASRQEHLANVAAELTGRNRSTARTIEGESTAVD